jgi:hypothetical protein
MDNSSLHNRPSGLLIRIAVLLAFAILASLGKAHAQTLDGNGLQQLITPSEKPLHVEVGIKIDQITEINQKAENFSAVVVIRMRWRDQKLAFDKVEANRAYKLMTPDEFYALASSIPTNIPLILFQNQQAQRWEQAAFVTIYPNGEVEYFERSTLTLQAPYFNFKKYPFDTQQFHLDVVSVSPLELIEFTPMKEFSGLGSQLGEEAWILENAELTTSVITGLTGLKSAKATLTFTGRRHIQYYALRIFLPLLFMILVSWASFFLEDYSKRIDIGGANLLVFVAFNFAISDSLPQLGYLTFLDFTLQWMFLVTTAVIVLNVGLRRMQINGNETLARRIDNYVIKWIFPLVYAGPVAFASYRYLFSP